MDGEAAALHAPKPGHLSFGKLVDGDLQAAEHLVVGGAAEGVFGDKLILQTVVDQILGRDRLEQTFYLLYHSFLQSLAQTARDACASRLPIDPCADDGGGDGWHLAVLCGRMEVVLLYLYRADGPLTGVYVRAVVHRGVVARLQVLEDDGQLVERLPLQFCPQRGILGHGRELVASQHGLDIESCAATEHGLASTTADVLVGLEEVALVFEEVVFRPRVTDVYQVVGDWLALHHIVGEVFARSDRHASIDLTTVGGNDFAVQLIGKAGGKGRLAACRGPKDGQ